jgi:hypothetical protein
MITEIQLEDGIKLAQRIVSDNRTLTEPKNYSLLNNSQVLLLADCILELNNQKLQYKNDLWEQSTYN